jgi:hypothetical protein
MIDLHVEAPEVEAGSPVRVLLRVAPGFEKRLGTLRFSIGWRTEGAGGVDDATVFETQVALKGDSCRVDLPTPPAGPLSFDGKLVRILWEVSASSIDREGLLFGQAVKARFRLLPRKVRV